MRRYIDADKLHDDLTKIRINLMQEGVDVTPIWQVLDCVRQQPTADVRENVRGEWTHENACPFCGFRPWFERDIHTLSFCPNCGADMRGAS